MPLEEGMEERGEGERGRGSEGEDERCQMGGVQGKVDSKRRWQLQYPS